MRRLGRAAAHLVDLAGLGVQRVIADVGHAGQLVNVGRGLGGVAEGEEDQLAVAVHVVVELDRVLVRAVNEPSLSFKFDNHGGSLLALSN